MFFLLGFLLKKRAILLKYAGDIGNIKSNKKKNRISNQIPRGPNTRVDTLIHFWSIHIPLDSLNSIL